MAKRKSHNYFMIRRLHSLVGIFPLGVFLIWYLLVGSYAFGGAEIYDKHMDSIYSFPILWILVTLFVVLPFLFHAVLGMIIFYTGKNNFLDYGYYKNWLYFIQRVTGVIVLIFAVLYTWQTAVSAALEGRNAYFADMQRALAPAWVKWFYVAAVLALAFHFANGICGALTTWGITRSQGSQKVTRLISWGLFILIGSWGTAILFAFI